VAAHLIWGAPSSVLVGDFLFARAFELMVETGAMKALEILARASRVIAEGEVLQLTRSHDLNLSQAMYLEIISAKTAELFAAAAEAGGVSAGADDGGAAAVRAYGLNLGLAFQLADDALDYGGGHRDPGQERWRRFPGRHRRRCRCCWPSPGPARAKRRSGSGRSTATTRPTPDFRRARELIVGCGALEATLDLAADYAEAAKAALQGSRERLAPWRSKAWPISRSAGGLSLLLRSLGRVLFGIWSNAPRLQFQPELRLERGANVDVACKSLIQEVLINQNRHRLIGHGHLQSPTTLYRAWSATQCLFVPENDPSPISVPECAPAHIRDRQGPRRSPTGTSTLPAVPDIRRADVRG